MGARVWVATGLGLSLGLAIGSGATYLWLTGGSANPGAPVEGGPGRDRAPLAIDNRPGEAAEPGPTQEDARASLQAILASAGVDAEVVQFRRTDWSRKPSGQNYYGVAYEADLAFRADGQIKETQTLLWSPQNSAFGWGGAMSVTAVDNVKKGDRRKVRGHIGYVLQEGQLKLHPNCKIDSAK